MSDSGNKKIDPMGSTTLGDASTIADTSDALRQAPQGEYPSAPGDRYELISELASGSMGTVWLATDRLLAREVAIKVLHRKYEQSHDAKVRFEYEARLTGRLDHPGIVPVYDLGQLPDGSWYFAMRRIQGSDLRERLIEILANTEEEYPLQSLLRLFGQLCLTVAYAHDRGFIHRDLKPANILVGTYGELYVADWGIAKTHLSKGESLDELLLLEADSVPGTLMGTVRYMSPEQVRGEVDQLMPQSDVFSLGIMLYQITTGTTPFSGESIVELMKSIVDCRVDPMTALPDGRPVPEAIRQLCRTVLTPNPEDRPTASELAERVTAFLDGIEERKRAVARAQENLAAGKSAIGQYTAARIDLAAKMATIQDVEQTLRDAPVLADAIGDGKALDPYLDVWRNRHEVKKSEHEAEHLYTRAVQALEQALESQELPAAHELLADLYWEKYAEARRLSDHPTALYFKALVLEHDRGQYANRLADKGHLEFVISPPNATVSIERYIESGPLYLPETVEWSGEALPVGTYRARVTLDGHQSADIPFLVEGNQTKVVTVDLVEGTFPGFSFIQGGETELGGDAEAPNALERTRVEVSTFLMAENPVTVGEYVEFLDALAENDVETAQGHAPRSPSGTRYVDYSEVEGRFMIPSADTDGDAWDPLWPIMMVNQLDALAYCAWRSARDGRIYRLPTEEEWEYAARGVDRRAYPWGNGYDRLISCSSRGIKNDQTESGHRSGPARIDEFPYDVSPFGVRHLGGLAIEWTSTLNYAGNCVLRGGGLFSTEAWCRAAARTAHSPDYLAVQFGFRLVLDIPEK